jgi:p-aminobenzoyl-glutamate transporter AbgT
MANIPLILVSLILSVFSIARNSLLIQKQKHLNKNEKNFAIVRLVGSLLILIVALFYGFKSGKKVRNAMHLV